MIKQRILIVYILLSGFAFANDGFDASQINTSQLNDVTISESEANQMFGVANNGGGGPGRLDGLPIDDYANYLIASAILLGGTLIGYKKKYLLKK